RSLKTYRQLKQAGANGVLYRFETSNSDLYAKLHPNKTLQDRLNNLKAMKEMGFTISTGSIIGLPGQTIDDLANDILLMKELGTFMPSIGPLIPSKNTPLARAKIIDFNLLLKIIAVIRLVMPTARIPVTTAMETIGGNNSRYQSFMAGSNSVMFNLTPEKYRESYNIYDNKFYDKEKKYEQWALFKGDLSYQMLEEELKIKI
ncbi:MAG: radical SAM protein, partial [Patescibacteria group bacterium]